MGSLDGKDGMRTRKGDKDSASRICGPQSDADISLACKSKGKRGFV